MCNLKFYINSIIIKVKKYSIKSCLYFFSSLFARQRRKKVRKKEENTQNSYALRAYFKFGKAESFNARKLALRASNNARLKHSRASSKATSEAKRLGEAQKRKTAEQK